MGVRILENADDGKAVIYDSVTDVAFGPVFYDLDYDEVGTDVQAGEVAEAFLDWLLKDARTYTPKQLADQYDTFRDALQVAGWIETTGEEVLT